MAVQTSSYDVFLSFRGADTRTKFTDHLYNALQVRQGIPTFRDSEELKKGQDLSQLSEAIEKSKIAVVILSSNYASSTWCLREVAKIVECRSKSGLIVLPVFYDIEPTQVRKQSSETFKESFDQHEQNFKDRIGEVESWRQALTEVATLVGWDLKDRLETTVIEEIVKCVDRNLKLKINPVISNEDSKDIVGMDRVREIELNFDIKGLDNVDVIGICGMPGVGKTTIAEVVFRRNWHHFEAKSFIANVGETRKTHGLLHIQKQLYQDLLGSKDITMSDIPAERRKLRYKKVLIILDGVTELKFIEELFECGGEELINWFGRGSRIIITTIDEKLLKDYEANIHKVGRLHENEARQLFFRKAFKKVHPLHDYDEFHFKSKIDHPMRQYADLSYKFVDLADGLPLAIVALGNLLLNRTLDQWKVKLRTLEANNYTGDEQIFGILKVCIDGLWVQAKEIFLDIACFFKGEDKKRAERIFESCGHDPVVNLNVLLEKSLVTIVGGKLWMHDLLQETGQKMVIGESELLGNRSRLWHRKDAISVLKQAKGTDAVRGIFLSSPRPDKVRLKADSFSNMDFLRLLKIKNVLFSGCLEFDLSNELSFMEWHGFPSTSLPSNFEPEKLVELHLPKSQIKQLWEETPPLEMLVIMDLSDCKYLTSTPDFQSMPNLEILILKGCTTLSEVDLPIGDNLQKLVLLNLEGCESLSSLSNDICSLRSLTTLILSGCSKLANLPENFGEKMKQLSELDLEGTAIKELPAASIKRLTGLIRLNLRDCKNLLSLPAIICSLTKLQVLNLSGCLKLDELPENLGSLVGLKELDASRSCIRQVPSSILLLKDLESLSFHGCGGLQLPASFSGLDSLTKLDLSYCKLSDGAIPADLDCLSSLDHLNLGGNSLVSVPESITKLSKLEVLLLNDCSSLRSLPHLPSSIQRVFARNCPLLVTYSNKLTVWTSTATGFCFINSQTREEHKLHRIPMTEQRLLRPHLQKFYEDIIYKGNGFEYITPHTKIPSWFDRQSEGSSITIPLPQNYFDGELELMGFALCFVYEAQEHENMESTASNVLAQELTYSCNYSCCLSTYGGPDDDCPLLVCKFMDHDYVGSFRHWVYIAGGLFAERLNKRSVRAQVIIDRSGVEVKACGARLIYSGGVTEFVRNLNLRDEIPSHIRNLSSGDQSNEQDQETTSDLLAEMERMISVYDTKGRNKQTLDHDAGSSSTTGSSTQVPHQRLETPKSNGQSNEQEQRTNSKLTHVAESGCASNSRFLIEIEPHTSTKIVRDQLGTKVESFLEELFELGGKAHGYDIGFLFSLRAILPWFNHQSIGSNYIPEKERIGISVRLPLPPELYNNKEWVGIALYVSFTRPPGVWHEASRCSFRSSLYTDVENLHYLSLRCDGEDKFKRSHRLFVIHIPRGRFEEQWNQCSDIYANFSSVTPGVEIEMLGMRVVYEQDLKGLIQTITQCTIKSPLGLYNGDIHGIVANGNTSSLTAILNRDLIKAAESSERRRSTLQEPLRDSKFISGQQIYLMIQVETPYIPLENKDSVVEWKRTLELLLECFFTFSDVSIGLTLSTNTISFIGEFSGIFLQKEIPEWLTPQHPPESMVLELPPNSENDVNFMGLLLCAAFSVHASEADILKYLESERDPQLEFHYQYSSSDQSYGLIEASMLDSKFMWFYRGGFIWQQYLPRDSDILKHLLHKDTSVKVSCRTDSISSKILGVQKCSFRILYKQDVEKLKQTIIQYFTSFFDNKQDIIQAYAAYLVDDPLYKYETTCSSDERESCGTAPVCQGETSGKSNHQLEIGAHVVEEERASSTNPPGLIPFVFEIEPSATTDSSSTKFEGDHQFRESVESLLSDLFRNKGNRYDLEFGFILSPRVRAILPWFNHQTIGSELVLHLPPDLYKDKKWAGLSLYVAFPEPTGSTTILCRCSLSTSSGHAETITFTTALPQGYFSGSERLCFIHKPRASFPEQWNKCSDICASFEVLAPVGEVEVNMCGAHLVYEQDLIGIIQTITDCTIRSPPVFYGAGLRRFHYQSQRGQPSANICIYMVTNLNERATRTPSTAQEPSKSLVGQVILLRIQADTPFKKKDSAMKWKKNLELLLKHFFRFPLSVTLTLRGHVISSIGDSDPYCLCSSSIIPQKGIPKWFCGVKSPTCKLETRLPPNLENDDNWLGFVVCAAFSVHASQADVLDHLDSGYYPKLSCHLQWGSERALNVKAGKETKIVFKTEFMRFYGRRFIWLRYIPHQKIKGRLDKSGRLEASFRTDSISSKVLGVQECSLRVLYKNDVEKLKQTIIQCFTSFFDNGDVTRRYIEDEDSGGHNNHADDRDSDQKFNDLELQLMRGNVVEERGPGPELIPFFIEIEPPASSTTKITDQLRRNIESSLEQLFQGDNARHYTYGFILSPRACAVMPWFSHQSIWICSRVGAVAESQESTNLYEDKKESTDLYKDKKWVGFALYVAFTTQSPDSDFSCICRLSAFEGNTLVSKITCLHENQFSRSRRLCFIHIPRARFPKQCIKRPSIRAEFHFSSPASEVEMCGMRVVYDEDVKGLVQTIAQSTITSPPVYFSRDNKTHNTPEGEIVAGIRMATSLVALSKACIQPDQPSQSTLSPPAVPSQKFGKVELLIFGYTPFSLFEKKVTIEWKRNLELLLQSFFRLDLSLFLSLGTDPVASFVNCDNSFYQHGLFPRKEIPEWFIEKSPTSTFVSRLPNDLESDNNWMGFVVCAAFSVHPHPTDVGNYKDSQLTSDINCKIRWSSDSSQFFSLRDGVLGFGPNNKFMWLSRRGFIWLKFISRESVETNQCKSRQLEASFESGSLALAVQKCSLRILYKQDVQEYKQTVIQCFASIFDNLDLNQPYNEDDDSQHNKEPIHEDDQVHSVGTTSLSEDTQPETKTTVPVPRCETSENSFNRFNSILFEPILLDNRSAVIFADFRGWEE